MRKIQLYRPQIRRAIRAAVGPAIIGGIERHIAARSWAQIQDIGARWGRIGYRLHKRYRRKSTRHLRMAFRDELSDDRIGEIVCGCFVHHVRLFLETFRLPEMSVEELASVVNVEGVEHIEAALERGKGAILFTGHLGNWEVGAVRLLHMGLPVVPLSRAPRSPRLARSIHKVRAKLDFPVIPIEEGVRGIMRALKDNKVVPILPDQYAWGKGLTVPYFGNPTHIWHTPALMAQRAGCPVIPTHAFRGEGGQFRLLCDPPVEPYESGDRDFDVWVTTARCMAHLEQRVRDYPDQYAWHYELWRPHLELAEPPYPMERLEGLV